MKPLFLITTLVFLLPACGGFISNYVGPLFFGLQQEAASSVEIRWPDKARTVTRLTLPGYTEGVLTVFKDGERFDWNNESSF